MLTAPAPVLQRRATAMHLQQRDREHGQRQQGGSKDPRSNGYLPAQRVGNQPVYPTCIHTTRCQVYGLYTPCIPFVLYTPCIPHDLIWWGCRVCLYTPVYPRPVYSPVYLLYTCCILDTASCYLYTLYTLACQPSELCMLLPCKISFGFGFGFGILAGLQY